MVLSYFSEGMEVRRSHMTISSRSKASFYCHKCQRLVFLNFGQQHISTHSGMEIFVQLPLAFWSIGFVISEMWMLDWITSEVPPSTAIKTLKGGLVLPSVQKTCLVMSKSQKEGKNV